MVRVPSSKQDHPAGDDAERGRKTEPPTTGIHDPTLAGSGWCSGAKLAASEMKGMEAKYAMEREELKQMVQHGRVSSMKGPAQHKKKHGHHHGLGDEVHEIEEEQETEYRATHPTGLAKMLLNLKTALYDWLKTGVEPL